MTGNSSPPIGATAFGSRPDKDLADRVTVVLLTFNCAHRLTPITDNLTTLGVPIVAVDNGSVDDTVSVLRSIDGIDVVPLTHNIGAAARNVGISRATTPYVAFCDDDGWYERDGLARAADALDAHPTLALVNARILVGADRRLDPISAEMADSPLVEDVGIPGAVLLGFMAGACVMRADAFRHVGGYETEFFMGGEEEALALKLVGAGWHLRYRPDVVCRHFPSQANVDGLRAFGLRNALWTCWIYRSPAAALVASLRLLVERPKNRAWVQGVVLAGRGLPWALARRQPLGSTANRQLQILDRHRRRFSPMHRHHRVAT